MEALPGGSRRVIKQSLAAVPTGVYVVPLASVPLRILLITIRCLALLASKGGII